MDIIDNFRRAVSRFGDRRFLFDANETATYRQVDERSDAVAAELVRRSVRPGDTVGLSSPDCVQFWVAIIGCWKVGAMPAMIDSRTSTDALPYFIDDIGATLVAATPSLFDRLADAGARDVVDISLGTDDGGDPAPVPPISHGPTSPVFLSYTSGTTGDPKGVALISEPVALGTNCIAERLQLSSSDVLLATTPIASSFQLVAALLPAVAVGASVGLAAGSTTDEIWDLATEHGATVLVGYPLTLSDVVNSDRATGGLPGLRLALSGGSSLAPRIKRDFAERLGVPLLESYGQSELGGFMALGSPWDPQSVLDDGFAGRPLPDRLAYVGTPAGDEVPAGELGEVLVAEGFFDHYRNKPVAFEAATQFGVLHTGDLGVSSPDGHLKVVGRFHERAAAVERGGFLRDVEDALYEHDAVKHAVVVEADGVIEAFVELRDGHDAPVDELASFVAGRVGTPLHPRRTTIVESMPRTFSGKADRLSLASRID